MASLKKLTARVTKLEGKLARARQRVLDKENKRDMKANRKIQKVAAATAAQDNTSSPTKVKKEKKVKAAA